MSKSKEEAKVTPKINKWFRKVMKESCPFEIKETGGSDTYDLADLSEHQLDWLRSCNSKHGCIYKIPDSNMGHLPFDCLFYKNAPAYIVIAYPKDVIVIHLEDYLKIETPSLHVDKAKEIATFITLRSSL